MFSDLKTPAPDPILGMAQRFAADDSPEKVDLGIGIYKDESGSAPVLKSVKRAEAAVLSAQTSKAYLSSAGNDTFNGAILELLLGADHQAIGAGRARTIQTPGGTGALKLAADLLRSTGREARVWVSDPTWANHRGIFTAAGHAVASYGYYDATTGRVDFERMLVDLGSARPGDVVILHGCCHNPTGADLSPHQWQLLSDRMVSKGLLPLVDLAYQGFGENLDADAFAVRLLANQQPEMLIASSCSKNFSLYRDRVGALTVVAANAHATEAAYGTALSAARVNYSMPPDHGAAVVAQILGDAEMRAAWVSEVDQMRGRIQQVRASFASLLSTASGTDYGFIAEHRGMFAYLVLAAEGVTRLREVSHVHVGGGGRVNVAGLTGANVDRVARAVAALMIRERANA